jgi:hypothetical protein
MSMQAVPCAVLWHRLFDRMALLAAGLRVGPGRPCQPVPQAVLRQAPHQATPALQEQLITMFRGTDAFHAGNIAEQQPRRSDGLSGHIIGQEVHDREADTAQPDRQF